jgi:prolyl 4-hydroxylase
VRTDIRQLGLASQYSNMTRHQWLVSALLLLSALLVSFVLPGKLVPLVSAGAAEQAEECSAQGADGNTCQDPATPQVDDAPDADASAAAARGAPVEVVAKFVNSATLPASLLWDDGEAMSQVVEHVSPNGGSIGMNSFVGHAFQWVREGTRDPLSDWFAMEAGKETYELTAAAANEVMSRAASTCSDRNPRKCQRDAANGECDRNPGWMIVNCPQACNSCELLDPRKRCNHARLNVSADNVWGPGDLDTRFLDILENFKQFGAHAVSRPPQGPWVIVFDNFMTGDEADEMVERGVQLGFKRSTDTGEFNERGEVTKKVSQSRTSSNAWCTHACEDHPTVQRLTKRIEDITKVPPANYEQFQLLQYMPGQFYRTHHDMGTVRRDIAGGHRIMTFFVYLSDVEEGGETHFPRVNDPDTGEMGLKVKAKRGQAVLWPSVMNDDPWMKDERTVHAALPVIKGVKYAANHWIHSHDFQIANKWGCTGAFD